MQNAWDKILDLIKRTGDRCIVINGKDGDAYVVMDLRNYENCVLRKSEVRDLTEDELLDRINRDVSLWQSAHFSLSNDVETDEEKDFRREEEDEYYIEPVD